MALVGPVCCVATLACVAASAAPTSTSLLAVMICSAPAFIILASAQRGRGSKVGNNASYAAHSQKQEPHVSTFGDEDKVLPVLRPPPEEAARIRARGEDPYAGQRLNYLAGTSVPFEPLLLELGAHQRAKFEEFEQRFPRVSADCKD